MLCICIYICTNDLVVTGTGETLETLKSSITFKHRWKFYNSRHCLIEARSRRLIQVEGEHSGN